MSGRAPGDTGSDGTEFLGQEVAAQLGWDFVEKTVPADRNGGFPVVGGSVSWLCQKFVPVALRGCSSLHMRSVVTDGFKDDEKVLLRVQVPHEHVTWLLIEKIHADISADLPTADSPGSNDTFAHPLVRVTADDVDVARRAVEGETVDLGGDGASIVLGDLTRRDFEKIIFMCPILLAAGPLVA